MREDDPSDSTEALRSLVEHCPVAIARLDRDGRHLYVNAAAAAMLGRPAAQIVGRTFAELGFAPATSELWLRRLREVFETARAAEFAEPLPVPGETGSVAARRMALRYVPDAAPDGRARAVIAYARVEELAPAAGPPLSDVTRLTLATRLAQIGVWEWDLATDRTVWNDEMLRIFGVRREDFTGSAADYKAFARADYRERMVADLEATFASGMTEAEVLARGVAFAPKELCIVRPDGEERITVGDAITIVDEQRRPVRVLGVSMDVTERRKAERVRDETEERFTKAFRFNPAPMVIASRDGRIIDANQRYADLLGFTLEELRGARIDELGIAPDARGQAALAAQLDAQGSIRDVPVQMRTRTGEPREVLLSAEVVTMAGERCALGFVSDLTEYNRLQAQLLQAQKLEAVAQLAGGVAHDFNNLLAVVNGCAEICLRTARPDDPSREELAAILAAGQRAAALTRQLLAFGRRQILSPRVIELAALVREFEPLIRPLLKADIALRMRLPQEPANVEADPGQLEQVLMNLVVNGRDAMASGGTLTIEVACVELARDRADHALGLPAGPYVTLAVSDTGHGIREEDRARIFEPFFTTKPVGKGSGLGLASVYGIVRQSGGAVVVESQPGHGARFVVYLPRSEAAADGGTSSRR